MCYDGLLVCCVNNKLNIWQYGFENCEHIGLEVVGCSKEGTHILNFLVLDCTAPIEEQLELDCTGSWGLPVEAAKEAVKCKDEIYLVIPDLQSAIEFQKGSHRL